MFSSLSSGGVGQDCTGHGTHVAASVGGLTFGAAKNCSLLAIRALDCKTGGDSTGDITGVTQASAFAWGHTGVIQESHWGHTGLSLGSHWGHTGFTLGSYRVDIGLHRQVPRASHTGHTAVPMGSPWGHMGVIGVTWAESACISNMQATMPLTAASLEGVT